MTYSALELPKAGDRVAVGMSGGVDSTMTVLLLKERGCIVTGVTMALWNNDMPDLPKDAFIHESCYGPGEEHDIEECRKFCAENDVPYHVIDVREEYKKQVLEYFKSEYRAGRTPNPCIRCNRFIKFGALLAGIQTMGIEYDYFCTGHYAKVVRGDSPVSSLYGPEASDSPEGKERPAQIALASDVTKDQAYFLYRLPSSVLEKVRFPLADFTKKQIFSMAHERNLLAANREESQDFIPEAMLDILFSDQPSVPGDIIDLDGHVLGRHRGIEHYTIGQRRGLGVSAKEPLYVAAIDKEKNLVVLGKDKDLFCPALIADDLVWPADYNPHCRFEANVKIRLASRPVPAVIEPYTPQEGETFTGDAVKVTFETPQRAVAPGQSVVFYLNGITIGGGTIAKSIKS
ncbi:MAG: tRNA 2-thiouridine(34) synthase MnmA [Treponema sp.]|nr:tRNA 2-thiouridine(34) synthase MnmA [Treponema sp.]